MTEEEEKEPKGKGFEATKKWLTKIPQEIHKDYLDKNKRYSGVDIVKIHCWAFIILRIKKLP
jgi:hypothetical protein